MISIPDAALGSIVAATVTGLVSLLGLIISKENKTSEFREAWIDNLRAELSLLVAHINAMQAATASTRSRNEAWKLAEADFLQANRCTTSIRLRLNPAEPMSIEVLSILKKFEQIFAGGASPTLEVLAPTNAALINASQALLKSEWRRVRNGETIFQVARAISFATLIAGVGILIFLWVST